MADQRVDPLDRWLLAISVLLIAAGLFHLGVFALDDRSWEGPLSWRKPTTFGLSFGLTLARITWVTSYLRVPARTRTLLMGVFAADCVVEVSGITLQAWRDVPSHLNTSTSTNAAVAYTLAAGGAVLIVILGTFAALALLGRIDASPSMTRALRAGFLLLLAGLISGAAMIAVGTTEMRTGDPSRAYELAGFLKTFHGVTLHAILVLPGLAWFTARLGWSERGQRRAVTAAVTGYGLAAGAALIWNLTSVLGAT